MGPAGRNANQKGGAGGVPSYVHSFARAGGTAAASAD